MRMRFYAVLLGGAVWTFCGLAVRAQAGPDTTRQTQHALPMLDLGGGWMLIGMAQAFPAVTTMLPTLRQRRWSVRVST